MSVVNFFYAVMNWFVQWFIIAAVLAFCIEMIWSPIAFGLFYGMVLNDLMSGSIDIFQASQISALLSFVIMLCRTKFFSW